MYSNLVSKSDFLTDFHPIAEQITKLADGGRKLDPKDYLLIRDHEKPQITEARVKKFAPRNLLGAGIKYLRIFQESGTLSVDLEKLPGDNALWSKFLNNVDGSETTLKEFVINIFETATKVKYAFVKVDLPYIEMPEEINQFVAETISSNTNRLPYLTEIPIKDVLNFDEENGKIKWIKYKYIEAVENPFSPTTYDYHIVVIDEYEIFKYTYKNVQLNDSGEIVKIFDPFVNRGVGGYRKITAKENPTISHNPIRHNRGECPVVKFELPDSLWHCNQVYKTQMVIHGLGMNMIHSVANAGFVQKWGQPYLQGKSKDGAPGLSQIPLPKDEIAKLVEKYAELLGDESILMMNAFAFEELQGTSIEVQEKVIDKLCDIVFNTIIYRQNILDKTSNVQTGTAKEFDREAQVLSFKANGKRIIGFTQQILKQVSRCLPDVTAEGIESISVSGMDNFNLRPVSTALENVIKVADIPTEKLPTAILKKVLTHLAVALTENDSQEEKQALLNEISAM